jgi:flagellar biosynthesis protein FlhB
MEETELDKSEEATPFKLKKAREKGTIARGMDLGFFTALSAFLAYAWLAGASSSVNIAQLSAITFRNAALSADTPLAVFAQAGFLFAGITGIMLVFAATVFVVVALFDFLQVGPVFSFQPLKPDFKRINPVQGLKRIFSWRMLIEALKSVLKLAIYGAITWVVIDRALAQDAAAALDGQSLMRTLGTVGFRLLFYFALAAMAIAAIDQMLARREFAKKMRMSRRELKREHRDHEGDPRFKQKRREYHNEFVKMAKSLRGAREADIILTNPTRYAIALRYDPDVMEAPKIVSRGANDLAARIRRIGFVYGVTISEDAALARGLFKTRIIDGEIPDQFFQPVADIYRKHQLLERKRAVRGG